MGLSKWPLILFLACVGLSIAWESIPAMLTDYALYSSNVERRTEFLETQRHLLARYPFLAAIVEESERIVSIGALLPAISNAWHANSVITTFSAVCAWLGNNFLAQLLSPDTWQEKAFLLGVLVIVLYIGSAIYMHQSRLKEYVRMHSMVSKKPTSMATMESVLSEVQ